MNKIVVKEPSQLQKLWEKIFIPEVVEKINFPEGKILSPSEIEEIEEYFTLLTLGRSTDLLNSFNKLSERQTLWGYLARKDVSVQMVEDLVKNFPENHCLSASGLLWLLKENLDHERIMSTRNLFFTSSNEMVLIEPVRKSVVPAHSGEGWHIVKDPGDAIGGTYIWLGVKAP